MSARGLTVALVGPDGAGKTTVAQRLPAVLDQPVRYLYMGVSAASSGRLLPTTRVAHALKRRRGAPPDTRGPRETLSARPQQRGVRAAVRAGLRLANRLAEEWSRQVAAGRAVRRGAVVVFDRHFFADYHAYDVVGPNRTLSRRLHGFVLSRLYPKPDLVVYLDAPAAVLLARKGEGTLEALERRRQDYLSLRDEVPAFAVVDATMSEDEVVAAVAELVERQASGGALPGEVLGAH